MYFSQDRTDLRHRCRNGTEKSNYDSVTLVYYYFKSVSTGCLGGSIDSGHEPLLSQESGVQESASPFPSIPPPCHALSQINKIFRGKKKKGVLIDLGKETV